MSLSKAPRGFFRLALAAPYLTPGKPGVNLRRQIRDLTGLRPDNPDLVVFPPLALTGVSLGDLNLQGDLLIQAERAEALLAAEAGANPRYILSSKPRLSNQGLILEASLLGQEHMAELPLALFTRNSAGKLSAAAEEKTDFRGGLAVVWDLAPAVLGERDALRAWAKSFSANYDCALAYLAAGPGESSADGCYSAFRLIAEAGEILAESPLFSAEPLIADLDLSYLLSLSAVARLSLRQSVPVQTNWQQKADQAGPTKPASNPDKLRLYQLYQAGQIPEPDKEAKKEKTAADAVNIKLYRPRDPLPFLPPNATAGSYYEEALELLTQGLVRRMRQLPGAKLILGLSGGLDSTLALLVAVRALDKLGRPRQDLLAVNMPGPGSHERSQNNARDLASEVRASFRTIPIDQAVKLHLNAIEHRDGNFDITYENAQARERTQILMDLANLERGFVLGTGDLSELALGWCTYNGDQMAMYNLNASVPKTLVRALCQYESERYSATHPRLAELLFDVLATPISPELLPKSTKDFSQKTEDVLGPYELHDFFLWHLLKRNAGPQKIFDLACLTFKDQYEPDFIRQTLGIFLRRFLQHQFKRSASPEGASLGLVSLSPRTGYRLPSDLEPDTLIELLESPF